MQGVLHSRTRGARADQLLTTSAAAARTCSQLSTARGRRLCRSRRTRSPTTSPPAAGEMTPSPAADATGTDSSRVTGALSRNPQGRELADADLEDPLGSGQALEAVHAKVGEPWTAVATNARGNAGMTRHQCCRRRRCHPSGRCGWHVAAHGGVNISLTVPPSSAASPWRVRLEYPPPRRTVRTVTSTDSNR